MHLSPFGADWESFRVVCNQSKQGGCRGGRGTRSIRSSAGSGRYARERKYNFQILLPRKQRNGGKKELPLKTPPTKRGKNKKYTHFWFLSPFSRVERVLSIPSGPKERPVSTVHSAVLILLPLTFQYLLLISIPSPNRVQTQKGVQCGTQVLAAMGDILRISNHCLVD